MQPNLVNTYDEPNIIELVNISFRYNKKDPAIFTDLNLNIPAHKFVCLWGPSGSGKSTLLSIVGGIIKPQSGQLKFLQKHAGKKQRSTIRQNCAWVTQSANVFSSMTALENASLAALAQGHETTQVNRKAKEVLAELGIAKYADIKTKYLSGGQSQRVAIARAITANTPLILGDEPTGQLDRESTKLVVAGLKASVKAGSSVIIASHDPAVAQACDLVYEVGDGQVVAQE